jgi:predicted O-methyltransferase YrrM
MRSPAPKLHRDKTDDPSYRPSYDFGGEFLGPAHRAAATAVKGIPGWLRDEDVLKLYELAWFAGGPLVEIGSHRGKSTLVLAGALRDAGSEAVLVSLDIDPVALADARRAVASRGLADRVVFVRGTARALFRAVPQLHPAVVFVDGDHSLPGARRDVRVLYPQVPAGALVLFHDYFDPRNADPAVPEVEVERAVAESWVTRDCEFAGVFGCCGLFRRQRGGPDPAADRGLPHPLRAIDSADELPPLLDLVHFDDLRMRYVQRLRLPLARWTRARLGWERKPPA